MQKSQGTHWSRYQLTVTAQGEDKGGGGDPKFLFNGGEVRVLDLLSELILLTSIILFYLSFSFIHFTAFPHGIYIGSLLGTGPAV